jgi:hypothetical protein
MNSIDKSEHQQLLKEMRRKMKKYPKKNQFILSNELPAIGTYDPKWEKVSFLE